MRKSKREKEKEAAEAKRKEEEENAAKAYAEFLDAFQGEDADRKKAGAAFVKSGQAALYEPSVKSRGEPSRAVQLFDDESQVCILYIWLPGDVYRYQSLYSLLHPHSHQNRKGSVQWTLSWRKSSGKTTLQYLRDEAQYR